MTGETLDEPDATDLLAYCGGMSDDEAFALLDALNSRGVVLVWESNTDRDAWMRGKP